MSFDISYNFEGVDSASPSINKVKKSFTSLNSTVEKTKTTLKGVSEKMGKVGRSISMKVGAPIAAMTALAIKKTKDFDLVMNEIKQTTGATAAQMDQYRQMATKANFDTEFSVLQVANAQLKLRQGNIDLLKSQKILNVTLDAASGYHLDTVDAAAASINMTKGYKLSVDQLSAAYDYLGVVHIKTGLDISEATRFLQKQSKVLIPFGVNLKQAIAMMGTFKESGIDLRSAGMGVAMMFQYMNKPSTQALKIMKQLGLSFKDAHGKMIPIPKILDQLAAAQKRIPPAQWGMFYSIMYGTTAGPLIQALVEHKKTLNDLMGQFGGAIGLTKKLADASGIGLPGALYRASAAFTNLMVNVVDTNETGLSGFVEWIAKIINNLSQASPATQKFIAWIAGLGMVLGPVLIGLGKMIFLLAVFGKLGWVAAVANLIGDGFVFMWGALLGPIGLIIIAVAAVVAGFILLYKHSAKFRKVVQLIGHALYKYMILPFKLVIGAIKKIISVFNMFHSKKMPTLAIQHQVTGGAPSPTPQSIFGMPAIATVGTQQGAAKTTSTLNINVNDPKRIIRGMHGDSDADNFNFNTGTNMAYSR